MSEMIERVAKHLSYELGDTMGDSRDVHWSGCEIRRAGAIGAARAVLEAMCDPTSGMMSAGADSFGMRNSLMAPMVRAFYVWQSMMEEALSDD